MSKKELEILEGLYAQAKRMYLNKFKFNGNFITLAKGKELISKAKR